MQLNDFARTILYGNRWEDKVVAVDDVFEDFAAGRAPAPIVDIPRFPGRPLALTRIGRSEFPSADSLSADSARGRLLHFFANHELLAMELMALALLKFPHAEPSFRMGLGRTIVEEQNHLRMYVNRMRELGVDFGDLPISDYFWKALKDTESPLQFVVHMSMTLEQANLDFSLFYQQSVAAVGDSKTAALLQTVYEEEIGHVKHGVTWFNRWRNAGPATAPSAYAEDDWDAYLRLLRPPMNPRRAKGPIFCAAARRQAGLSQRYINEIEVYSGSKGRPPTYWFYNPLCEAEIARGKPGFTATQTVQNLNRDLGATLSFLALDTDVVLVPEPPRAAWLKTLQLAGVRLPEFRTLGRAGDGFPERHIAGFQPWGWSPDAFERFKPGAPKLISIAGGNGVWCRSLLDKPHFNETPLGPLFSKNWSLHFYRDWMQKHPSDQTIFAPQTPFESTLGQSFATWKSARAYLEAQLLQSKPVLAKAPWGTSGSMNKRVLALHELDSNLGKWIENTIESQGSIILEPWLNKVADLSVQIEVGAKPKVLGVRQFLTGSRLEYRGTYLGAKLRALTAEQNRFLHAQRQGASPATRWHALAEAIGAALYAHGYEGNAGVDALLATHADHLFLRPVVEINPRWTMGRVALELEAYVFPGAAAAWLFLPASNSTAQALADRHPVKRQSLNGKQFISEGVLFTNDPEAAREVLTVLAVGDSALEDCQRLVF